MGTFNDTQGKGGKTHQNIFSTLKLGNIIQMIMFFFLKVSCKILAATKYKDQNNKNKLQ